MQLLASNANAKHSVLWFTRATVAVCMFNYKHICMHTQC